MCGCADFINTGVWMCKFFNLMIWQFEDVVILIQKRINLRYEKTESRSK